MVTLLEHLRLLVRQASSNVNHYLIDRLSKMPYLLINSSIVSFLLCIGFALSKYFLSQLDAGIALFNYFYAQRVGEVLR